LRLVVYALPNQRAALFQHHSPPHASSKDLSPGKDAKPGAVIDDGEEPG